MLKCSQTTNCWELKVYFGEMQLNASLIPTRYTLRCWPGQEMEHEVRRSSDLCWFGCSYRHSSRHLRKKLLVFFTELTTIVLRGMTQHAQKCIWHIHQFPEKQGIPKSKNTWIFCAAELLVHILIQQDTLFTAAKTTWKAQKVRYLVNWMTQYFVLSPEKT